jgi:hypothetical protein
MPVALLSMFDLGAIAGRRWLCRDCAFLSYRPISSDLDLPFCVKSCIFIMIDDKPCRDFRPSMVAEGTEPHIRRAA